MADIRPLERSDLPAVVALLRAHMRGWALDERILAGLMLDDPWADEELPSLVAVDRNEIVGFTGVQVRRMRMDGRAIRGVCSTQGVVTPDRRGSAVGALLIGRVLSGPQDVTWSDNTIDPVMRVFRVFGGQVDQARACDWMFVLRPTRWIRGVLGAVARHRGVSRALVPVGALPFQAAGPRIMRRAFPAPSAGVVGEDATAASVVEYLPALSARLRVWVDHDEEHLEHLFGLVRSFTGPAWGRLVCRLVRRGERPIGWYAYVLRRGGVSRVLHLAALEREADTVLGELVSHARAQGSAVLTGRAEPHLQGALSRRLAVLGYARQPTILAKDPELAAAMATSSSFLTRLEGEVFAI
jgi:hypothetical protein